MSADFSGTKVQHWFFYSEENETSIFKLYCTVNNCNIVPGEDQTLSGSPKKYEIFIWIAFGWLGEQQKPVPHLTAVSRTTAELLDNSEIQEAF